MGEVMAELTRPTTMSSAPAIPALTSSKGAKGVRIGTSREEVALKAET